MSSEVYLDPAQGLPEEIWQLYELEVDAAARTNGTDPESVGETALAAFPTTAIGELARWVEEQDPPRFIIRPILVAEDYGVLGADKKFGKTWIVADIAVNVAHGGAVFGRFPVDHSGPVLLFAGEGGRRKIVRRFRAVAEHYGESLDDLAIHVYERAPKLGNNAHVRRLELTIEHIRPVLVIVDPAYLAISGAETRNLVSMGELLERAQIACQDHGAALLMVHHWNKGGTGTGADRFTGTGFAEWGRVLLSGSTETRHTDSVTGESSNVLRLEISGDEIPDTKVYLRRRVSVDDQNDLASPMRYHVERVAESDLPSTADAETDVPELVGAKLATRKVYSYLLGHRGQWLTPQRVAADVEQAAGKRYSQRTIYEALQQLNERGLVSVSGTGEPDGKARTWTVKKPTEEPRK